MSVRFKHLPPDLLSKTVTCACGKEFPIPFFEEMAMPLKPVIPRDHHPVTNNVHWALISIEVNCPSCVGRVRVEIPTVKAGGQLHLYGDEATRKHGPNEVFTYSMVGADPTMIPEVCDRLNALKRKWAPNLLPNNWRMHMTEAWSGDNRLLHNAYSTWNKCQVDRYVEDVLLFFEELQSTLFVFNVCVAAPSRIQELRDMAYTALLLNTIRMVAEKGTQPHFIFDSNRVCGPEGTSLGWAARLLEVKQKTLLYAFLARGLVIPEPRFIQPGSHPFLELADFVSFWIARYHFRKWQGKKPEFETDRLGRIFYLGVCKNGNLEFRIQKGLPWDAFYS